MTLANGFNCSTQTTQSNYAVNPNYRLGMVQVCNLDIQRTLGMGVVLNVGYNGAMGGQPGHGARAEPDGDRSAEPDLGAVHLRGLDGVAADRTRWRSMRGSGCKRGFRCRRRIPTRTRSTMRRRWAAAATRSRRTTRTWPRRRAIRASTVRHKLTGTGCIELPFGPNRAFLNKGGVWSKIMDGFSISGDYTFATGTLRRRRTRGRRSEIAAGAGNSLRPNRVPGQSINGPRTLKKLVQHGCVFGAGGGDLRQCFEEFD